MNDGAVIALATQTLEASERSDERKGASPRRTVLEVRQCHRHDTGRSTSRVALFPVDIVSRAYSTALLDQRIE